MIRGQDPNTEELDASFLDGLAEDEELDDETAARDLAELERMLAKERGLAAWLRSRSTAERLALGLGLSLGLVLTVGLLLPRADVSELPPWRVATVLSSLSALFAASVWFGLRPLHRPPVAKWVEPSIVAAALFGMVALAFLPLTQPMPSEPTGWAHAVGCMFGGILFGLPAYIVLRLLDRGGRRLSAFLAAAAAALSANAALAMHCENDSVEHLLKGHAMMGVLFVGAVALWHWVIDKLVSRSED